MLTSKNKLCEWLSSTTVCIDVLMLGPDFVILPTQTQLCAFPVSHRSMFSTNILIVSL